MSNEKNKRTSDYALERFKMAFGVEKTSEVAKLLGVAPQSVTNMRARGTLPRVLRLYAEKNGVVVNFDEIKSEEDEVVFIPLFDVCASAGGGSLVESETVVDVVALKEEWVRRELHVSPSNLCAVSTIGVSMEPTFRAGDLLILDRSVERIRDEGIYALVHDGMLLIKRVRWSPDGGLVLISDNKEYEPQTIPRDRREELRVVGRLVLSIKKH
jgi:phage repressor protein C with HTH and peptisase S24 domain